MKTGDEVNAKLTLAAIEAKLPYLQRYTTVITPILLCHVNVYQFRDALVIASIHPQIPSHFFIHMCTFHKYIHTGSLVMKMMVFQRSLYHLLCSTLAF